MTFNFNCPNCGGENTDIGDEKTSRYTFCGREVLGQTEVVNAEAIRKLKIC